MFASLLARKTSKLLAVRKLVQNAARIFRPGVLGALAALPIVFGASRAHAQADYFYLDRAQLSGAPDDGFMVWRPHTHEETRFYGSAVLGYAHNPLRAATVTANPVIEERIDNPVQGQLITYLMVGTEVANRVGFNVALPITLLKLAGDDPSQDGIGAGGIEDNPVAIHDLRLDGRVKLFESDSRKLRLGVGGAVWVPTGRRPAFTGDGQSTGMIYGSGEYDFGKFFLSGMLGPHFRPERSIGGASGALFLASELRWAFGGYVPMRGGKLRLGVELFGSTGLTKANDQTTFFTTRNTVLEWLAQARFLVDKRERIWVNAGLGTRLSAGYGAPDFRILGGIGTYLTLLDFKPKSPPRKVSVLPDVEDYDKDTDGDGYPDSIDKCPTIKEDGKEPEPSDGCPAGADRDNDGIPDAADSCPDQPEDKDGIQDNDGCPETDADNDQIPDVQDKCPTEPGPRSSVAEKNGCPSLIKESEGEVEILQPIEFEHGKAAIKPVSFPILDEVVTLMKARSGMRIAVHGHTDSTGSAALNLNLSRERARSVMNYIVGKGIAANRLESQGFGQTKPIADNNTDEGRARNRRVEFKILQEE